MGQGLQFGGNLDCIMLGLWLRLSGGQAIPHVTVTFCGLWWHVYEYDL